MRKKKSEIVRVGVDTGGTFTDFVFVSGERASVFKVASTPADPSRAITEGLKRIADETGAKLRDVVEPGQPEHRLEIFGARGALRVEDKGDVWHAPVGAGEWRLVETARGDVAPGMRDSGWARGFTRFAQEIVKALRDGRTRVEEAATFEDGYRTQLVLDAARRAHEENRRVVLH